MNTLRDEQLLVEFLSGREECFELLVRRYSQELFQFAYRCLGSAASAEDMVQETMLQVYQSAGSFDRKRRFRPWVFTIAANKIRDYLRSRRRHPEVSLDASTGNDTEVRFVDLFVHDPEESLLSVEQEERSMQIRHLVNQLPPPLREVLVLGYYHGFAYKELSELLNIPLGTVKSRLHAAVQLFGTLCSSQIPDRLG